MIRKTGILLSFCALTLAGCSTDREAGQPPAYFGSSVQQNIAAQIVNPDAPAPDAKIRYNGERAALAQARYVTNKTAPLQGTSTTSSGGGGGGSGGSSGGGTGQ